MKYGVDYKYVSVNRIINSDNLTPITMTGYNYIAEMLSKFVQTNVSIPDRDELSIDSLAL